MAVEREILEILVFTKLYTYCNIMNNSRNNTYTNPKWIVFLIGQTISRSSVVKEDQYNMFGIYMIVFENIFSWETYFGHLYAKDMKPLN